jgi:heme oxygenase
MSLREAIADKHHLAEVHPFAQVLLSGNITNSQYGNYLAKLWRIYAAIERRADEFGLFDTLPGLHRAPLIRQDMEAMLGASTAFPSKTVAAYVNYIYTLNKQELLAHIYVRHMGDMYGGQLIKSKVPGDHAMYAFEERPKLIVGLRALLNDDLADEANVAFDWVLRIFDDMAAVK